MLKFFWEGHNPTQGFRQGNDIGSQYSSVIFATSDAQARVAGASLERYEEQLSLASHNRITTEIELAPPFYYAEERHQQYLAKHQGGYCGLGGTGVTCTLDNTERDDANKDRSADRLSHLTPIQHEVTQNDATERAFDNEFWDQKEEGTYVDVVSGEPLFASVHKYDSGSGWPSFFQALAVEHINEVTDRGHGMIRTEVRSRDADSHLGHLFPDGPEPTGLRYCINSAALRFVPREELEALGYGEYLQLFDSDE